MIGKIRIRTAFALCAASFSAGACAVYDGSLLSSDLAQGGTAGEVTAGAMAGDGSGGDGALIAGGSAGAGTVGVSGSPSVAGDKASAGDAGDAENGGAEPTAGASTGGSAGQAGTAANGGASGALGAAGGGGTAGALEGGAGSTGGAIAGSGGNIGSAGSGGAVGVVTCADHPLSQKSTWAATASHQSTTPKNPPSCLIDGANTRWSSGKPQSGDEWLQIDFGASVSLRGINLQQGADTNDYPRSYALIVSDTKNDLTGTVQASGVGTSGVTTTITLPKPVAGRYLLIKQLGSSLSWWSVAEVEPSCTDN